MIARPRDPETNREPHDNLTDQEMQPEADELREPLLRPRSDRIRVSLPQSGAGIASFVIAAVAGLLFIGLAVTAAYIAGSSLTDPSRVTVETIQELSSQPALAVIGVILMGAFGAALIGVILGIAGLVQRHRKRLFAVLGTILNLLILVVPFLAGLYVYNLTGW